MLSRAKNALISSSRGRGVSNTRPSKTLYAAQN